MKQFATVYFPGYILSLNGVIKVVLYDTILFDNR